MARETASIINGKNSAVIMSAGVIFGIFANREGSEIINGPKKLKVMLVLAETLAAESQITGNIARTPRPCKLAPAPLRLNPMAIRSRMGMNSGAWGPSFSHGMRRQLANIAACIKRDTINSWLLNTPAQTAGAATTNMPIISVSGNWHSATWARVPTLRK
ncbi:hypothetical protein [Arthrobacter sp. R1-13]